MTDDFGAEHDARRSEAMDRLAQLGFTLPERLSAKGGYVPARAFAGQLWVAGHTGRGQAGPRLTGVVGDDVALEQAQDEARRAALNVLAAVESCPDLAHGLGCVEALLHVRVFVRGASDFDQHPAVADGASSLLHDVLGPTVGTHARTAVGVPSLPGRSTVEVEAVLAYAA